MEGAWNPLGSFGRFLEPLGSPWTTLGRHSEALASFPVALWVSLGALEKPWDALGSPCKVSGGVETLNVLDCLGKPSTTLGRRLEALGRIRVALCAPLGALGKPCPETLVEALALSRGERPWTPLGNIGMQWKALERLRTKSMILAPSLPLFPCSGTHRRPSACYFGPGMRSRPDRHPRPQPIVAERQLSRNQTQKHWPCASNRRGSDVTSKAECAGKGWIASCAAHDARKQRRARTHSWNTSSQRSFKAERLQHDHARADGLESTLCPLLSPECT